MNILPSSLFKWMHNPLRMKCYLFVETASPYRTVNTLLLGYRNQLIVYEVKITDCLGSIQNTWYNMWAEYRIFNVKPDGA